MKKTILFTLISLFVCSTAMAQNGHAFLLYEGKLVFVNATPVTDYTVVGKAKYKNSKKNEQMTMGDVSGLAKVIVALDDVNEQVKKGKHPEYDAVVVYSPIKIELVNFSTDIGTYAISNVGEKSYSKKCGDKRIYLWSKPLAEYEVAKVLTVKNFTNLGQMKMGKHDIDNFMNKLYERSCKENKKTGVEFDAIMYNDPNAVNDRGFLSSKTIDLIKFK